MTSNQKQMIETRKTEWKECIGGPWYPSLKNGGFTDYRIWQQFDGLRWFQRHEWRCADGTSEMGEWINGVTGWCES